MWLEWLTRLYWFLWWISSFDGTELDTGCDFASDIRCGSEVGEDIFLVGGAPSIYSLFHAANFILTQSFENFIVASIYKRKDTSANGLRHDLDFYICNYNITQEGSY